MKVNSPEFNALWDAVAAAAKVKGFEGIYAFAYIEFSCLSVKKQRYWDNDPALWIETDKAMRATLRRALRTIADGI